MSLIEETGEELPVAVDLVERTDEIIRLDAMVPPRPYPALYEGAILRQEGETLALKRFPKHEHVRVAAHEFITLPLTLRAVAPVAV